MDDKEKKSLTSALTSGMTAEAADAIITRIAKAEDDNATLQKDRDGEKSRADQAEADRDSEKARADQAEKDRDAEKSRADEAEAARNAVAEENGVLQGELPAKPRSIAPIAEDKRLSAEDLLEHIRDADDVQIAFSDGRKEVKGLPPIDITGEPWKVAPNGLLLTLPVTLDGPGINEAAYVVEGYALFLDGELVAYTPREPVRVAAGQHVRLENDIFF